MIASAYRIEGPMKQSWIAAASLPLLLLTSRAFSQDRLAAHSQSLTAAGFAGTIAVPVPPQATVGREVSVKAEFIYRLNEAVSNFPALEMRQNTYRKWAASRPSGWPYLEYDLFKMKSVQDKDYQWRDLNITHIAENPGQDGRLTLRTMAIPLFASKWRILAIWSDLRCTHGLESMLEYYKLRGEVRGLTQDYANEKRHIALVTALELQKDYVRTLASLVPASNVWAMGWAELDADHLEPGQVPAHVWKTLKETSASIDLALDRAETTSRALPPLLTAAFFSDLDLPVEESERKRAESVRAMLANKVENCAKGTCFFDENGRLSHWVQYGVTGYASIEREQSAYNAWADRIWHTSRPKHVTQSGQLNLETFRIPVVKADYRIGEMWFRLLRDAGKQYPDFRSTDLQSYLKNPGGLPFSDGIFKTRADVLIAAYGRARAYEQALAPLNALLRPGVDQGRIDTEPIEASQLPAGTAENLSRLRKALEAAVDGAAEVEEASR